jgi:cardiolipin synthase
VLASLRRTAARVAVALTALMSVAACDPTPPPRSLPDLPLSAPTFAATVQAYTGAPVVGGNRIDLLLNGDQILPAKLAAVRAARTSITYAEYFYAEGQVAADMAAALAERCRAGVQVHVLLDGVGTLSMEREHRAMLERARCHVATFRPLGPLSARRTNYRNHRRVLVIDGRLGITGGSGVSWKWTGNGRQPEHWRDTDVRIEGPVVEQLQAAFADNWLEATGEMLTGPLYFPGTPPTSGGMRAHAVRSAWFDGGQTMSSLFLLAISGARRSIHVTNPYFIPDDALADAFLAAARRGVKVVVLVPGVIDHALVREAGRANFGTLLQAGIEIHEYQPALLHSKTMVVDGMWATVGSTNLDHRSFALNDELNVAVYDAGFAARLERAFADDLEVSKRVTYESWRARGLAARFFELVVIPIRDLL